MFDWHKFVKITMRILLVFFLANFSRWLQAQPLEGAYLLIVSQYGDEVTKEEERFMTKGVKLFKDGYWISASFGHPKYPFGGSGGGTFTTQNGKYSETLRYYSWDSTAVGKTYTFDYRLEGDRFTQSGFINSEKYQHYLIKEEMKRITPWCELKDASLEGVWFLQEASNNGESNFSVPMEQIKIYAYPRFAWARYNTATGQFLGTGGGSYFFDGKKLIEHIEYITYDLAMGSDVEIEVELQGLHMQQSSWSGTYQETWQRARKIQ